MLLLSGACQEEVEDCSHFFLCCETFKANFNSLWKNLNSKVLLLNPTDGTLICSFLNNLDQNNKISFPSAGLPLPFEAEICIIIRRFLSSAVGNIRKIQTDKLRGLKIAMLQDIGKMKVQYLMSLLFDLFEILQAVRSEQMNFA